MLFPIQTPGQPSSNTAKDALAKANALYSEATDLESRGDWKQAIFLRQQVVQELERGLGMEHLHTDVARTELASSLEVLGRYAQARAVFEQCLQTRIKALGENAPAVAETLNRIGETYRHEGMFTNSLSCYKRALQIVELIPKPVLLRAVILNNQAQASIALGNNAIAEALLQNCLQILQRIDGVNPAMTAAPLSTLGELHRNLGLVALAQSEQTDALALLSNVPPSHPVRLSVENNRASALRDLWRTDEAIPIYTNIIQRLCAIRGGDDLEVVQVQRNLAKALAMEGNHAAAQRVIEDVVSRLRSVGYTNLPLYAGLMTDLGDHSQNLGDLQAARQSFEAALDLPFLRSAPEHTLTCGVRERLASLAMSSGDLARAHELLELALTSRKRNAQIDPRCLIDLASTFQDWARFERVLGVTV